MYKEDPLVSMFNTALETKDWDTLTYLYNLGEKSLLPKFNNIGWVSNLEKLNKKIESTIENLLEAIDANTEIVNSCNVVYLQHISEELELLEQLKEGLPVLLKNVK